MAERILSDEKIEEIKRNIEMNGGQPVSENLQELENYLQTNPPGTIYLDN